MTTSAVLRHIQANTLKTTLTLPKTTFPLRLPAAALKSSPHLPATTSALYKAQLARGDATRNFRLHDGPPYANGAVHLGHALNKILKDMVNRVQVLGGARVEYTPGWDCHGLPIELKALAATKAAKGTKMTALQVRAAARDLATRTVGEQMAAFRSWGVMGDWDGAYKTMELGYEVRQLQVFREMVQKGLVWRRFKPVYWSPSSGSALAEAELEYEEKHRSEAACVVLPMVGEDRGVVVWTTTPWTIPANKAVGVGREMEYVTVEVQGHGKLIVAKGREAYLEGLLGEGLVKAAGDATMTGAELVGKQYTHPLLGTTHPIIAADFVSADSGTGLVHLAPGHGMDDYLVCQQHDIAPFSPVDDRGKFTADVGIPELEGQPVLTTGTTAVLELLRTHRALLQTAPFHHKYPYDWRTKKPVIVRATAQWFADVESIKAPAVAALADVAFVPESGRSRLSAFVRGRSEWCISRQRAWGVPIPALYDTATGAPLLTDASVSHIISELSQRGTDAWFDPAVPDAVWVAPAHAADGKTYTRVPETMDVWFDSGSSWTSLPAGETADLYLEGTDQARGWFQSSLLTSIAVRGAAPFRQVVTHGFVLDGAGKKMSKSLGNTIVPSDITEHKLPGLSPKLASTADANTLRLWVASTDFTRDVSVGVEALTHIHQLQQKLRTTARFLLGLLADFDPTLHSVPYAALTPLDKLALHDAATLNTLVRSHYATHTFHRAAHALGMYSFQRLSSLYLDALKDRAYTAAPTSPARRSLQTACLHLLRNYASLLSPLAPTLAAEIYAHAPASLAIPAAERDHLRFYTPAAEFTNATLAHEFAQLEAVRDAARRALERAKAAGRIGVPLEAVLRVDGTPQGMGAAMTDALPEVLAELCGVSGVERGEVAERDSEAVGAVVKGGWMRVKVLPARERGWEKCRRCWKFAELRKEEGQEGQEGEGGEGGEGVEGGVCGPCGEVVEAAG
ncbi:isoleucyl-tRNA synthetase [Geopyxis carbonaria]|nr:isoleucyl-tRNA synthetase [Geopyxis carbonaria]